MKDDIIQAPDLDELTDIDKTELDDDSITKCVKKSLRRKFQQPEWGLFFEVPGPNGRRADAIAFNLYPSRNFRTIGFEIKATRSDWKRELKDASKNDWHIGQVDDWYVIAGRKGIVKESELPDGWGLYEMKGGGKLYEIVESNLSGVQNRDRDTEFFARLVKKAVQQRKQMKQEKSNFGRHKYREGLKEGKKRGSDELDHSVKEKIRKGEILNEVYDERETVIPMDQEDKKEELVRALDFLKKVNDSRLRRNDIENQLEKTREKLKESAEIVDDAIEDFEQVQQSEAVGDEVDDGW